MNLFDKPLFVGAHSDDIELFAGGTVARYHENCKLTVFSQHAGCTLSDWEEAVAAAKIMGVTRDQLTVGDLPACQPTPRSFADYRDQIFKDLAHLRDKWSPTVVITHQSSDTNQDHKQVHDEVKRVFRNTPILGGCFPYNDLPAADRRLFVLLGREQVEAKVAAIRAYKSQLLPHRSYMGEDVVRAQLRFYGTLVNSVFAEAFEIIRIWV